MYHEHVNIKLKVENTIQIKSGITINVDASVKIKKKHCACEKDYIWYLVTCSCETGKYLASVIYDSVITCDEIIEETKRVTTNFNEKSSLQNQKKSIFYLPFYWLPLPYW